MPTVKKGKPGGQGGDAGKSGKGANGGNILIGFVEPRALKVKYSAERGDGGVVGEAGEGGPGGDGGKAGSYFQLMNNPGSFPRNDKVSGWQGATGDQGSRAEVQGSHGETGEDGSFSVNSLTHNELEEKLTIEQLAQHMVSYEQLLIVQRAMIYAYINAKSPEEYQYPLELGYWLAKITRPFNEKGFQSNLDDADVALIKSVHKVTVALLGQLQRNTNFYGVSKDHVAVLLAGSVRTRLDQLIELGNLIDKERKN